MGRSNIAYYLKINAAGSDSLNVFWHWVRIAVEAEADYYIVADREDVKLKIKALYAEKGYPEPDFIASYRDELRGICSVFCDDYWVNAGCAHLTPYIHAREKGYSGFWGIDADDTVFYASPSVSASLLGMAEDYAVENRLNVFSLDMWHSIESNNGAYHWTFGVAFSNLNIDYFGTFAECNALLGGNVISLIRKLTRIARNMDSYFSVLIQFGMLSAATFCFEGLWFEHIDNWISRYGHDEIKYIWNLRGLTEVPLDREVVRFKGSLEAESSPELGREISGAAALAGRKNIVLFGCGKDGKRKLSSLRFRGIEVRFFCDNNPALWGSLVEGVEVIAPERLRDMDATIIVASRKYAEEMKAQLSEMGIEPDNR